jgi:ferredoxin
MRALVDPDRCQGHGMCAALCPGVFDMDDEGTSFVTMSDIPESLHNAVVSAVGSCPEEAITLH